MKKKKYYTTQLRLVLTTYNFFRFHLEIVLRLNVSLRLMDCIASLHSAHCSARGAIMRVLTLACQYKHLPAGKAESND